MTEAKQRAREATLNFGNSSKRLFGPRGRRTAVISIDQTTMSPSWLFPVAQYEQGFTTAGWEGGFQNITHVPLADKPLGVHKSGGQLPHNVVFPPPPRAVADGETIPQLAWESLFPQGSINPAGDIKGGFGFYLTGPPGFAARLETATEALFSYKVMFEDGFEWVKGGKLPGACELC